MLVFITTFKNTFHAFILQFPAHSAPFKWQTALTEELDLTPHNKSDSSTSSIATCPVSMSMLKTQCCTYSAPELLLPPGHKGKHDSAFYQTPVCQTVLGDHLYVIS